MKLNFDNKRVLVIGGTGFIGGRLVEKLVSETNAQVRVLVRNYARIARLARFSSVERIAGNILDLPSLMTAMQDCDVVFDLAFGNMGSPRTQRKVTVDGTKNVMEAALRTGVACVVYTSTISVYGNTVDGDLDETSSYLPAKTAYAQHKAKAEKIVSDYMKRGLPAVIIQPTVVYGAYGGAWTIGPLNQLKTSNAIVIEEGLCNAVYVDDVVQALLLASVSSKAVGETFLISDERPVKWTHFCRAYEQMLGVSSSYGLSKDEALACIKWQSLKNIGSATQLLTGAFSIDYLIKQPLTRDIYAFARSTLPEFIVNNVQKKVLGEGHGKLTLYQSAKPMRLFNGQTIHFLAAKTKVRIDKAKRLLGYQPMFDIERGMALTEQWARWADLLA